MLSSDQINHNLLNNYSITTKEYLAKIYACQQKFLHAYYCLTCEQQTQFYEITCNNSVLQPQYPFVMQLNTNGLIMVHLGHVEGGMPPVVQAQKASKVSDFIKYNSVAFQNQLSWLQSRSNINLKPHEMNYSSNNMVIAIDRQLQSILPKPEEYRAIPVAFYQPNLVVQPQLVQTTQKQPSIMMETEKCKEVLPLKKRIKKTEDDIRHELQNEYTKKLFKGNYKLLLEECRLLPNTAWRELQLYELPGHADNQEEGNLQHQITQYDVK